MKKILLFVLVLMLAFTLKGNESSNDRNEYNIHDVEFYIGHIHKNAFDIPEFTNLSEHDWVKIDFLRKHGILDEGKYWIRVKLQNNIDPKNYVFINSVKNNLAVYYGEKIFPKNAIEENLNKLIAPGNFEGKVFPIGYKNGIISTLDYIYFSFDMTKDTAIFKFFPIVIGGKSSITNFIRERELSKKRTNFGFIFIGSFLIVASIVSLIIFFVTIKKLNIVLLLFSLLMGTAGIFYWLLSPLSLIFSDFTHTRMLTLLVNYHLIWFFFGLLISSFLKRRILLLMPIIMFTSLIFFFIPMNFMFYTKFFILAILLIFHLAILYFLKKDEDILYRSKSLFFIASLVNLFYIIFSVFVRTPSIELYLAPIGVGMLFWVFAFGNLLLKQYNTTINELHSQKIKNLELTETNLQSQLSILKKQLDPHFLFNSLGTLVALVETDQDTAVNYIQEFSQVYRYILDTQDLDFVTLGSELKFCNAYTYLIKMRFSDSIEMNYEIKPEYESFFVPPLSIQMLIENAIKHNIATPERKLIINFKVDKNQLVVSNNMQVKKQATITSKMGLKNLNQRLYLLKKLNIVVSETDNQFIVKLPLIREIS